MQLSARAANVAKALMTARTWKSRCKLFSSMRLGGIANPPSPQMQLRRGCIRGSPSTTYRGRAKRSIERTNERGATWPAIFSFLFFSSLSANRRGVLTHFSRACRSPAWIEPRNADHDLNPFASRRRLGKTRGKFK